MDMERHRVMWVRPCTSPACGGLEMLEDRVLMTVSTAAVSDDHPHVAEQTRAANQVTQKASASSDDHEAEVDDDGAEKAPSESAPPSSGSESSPSDENASDEADIPTRQTPVPTVADQQQVSPAPSESQTVPTHAIDSGTAAPTPVSQDGLAKEPAGSAANGILVQSFQLAARGVFAVSTATAAEVARPLQA